MKRRETQWMLLACGAALGTLAAVPFCHWQNNGVELTRIRVGSEALPPSFDGFRILQISDLHNKAFGKEQKPLAGWMRRAAPDVVVITGDLIDSRHPGRRAAMECIKAALALAPVYYVPGNHEARSEEYPELRTELLQAGVQLLEDRKALLKRGEEELVLAGVRDPRFWQQSGEIREWKSDCFVEQLETLCREPRFTVLLAHQPGYLPAYVQAGADVVLCGHVHGGVVRLPGIGGVFGPDRRFFPRYDAGLYQMGNTQMAVSRGLGGSVLPQRLFNRPELVLVTLHRNSPSGCAGS